MKAGCTGLSTKLTGNQLKHAYIYIIYIYIYIIYIHVYIYTLYTNKKISTVSKQQLSRTKWEMEKARKITSGKASLISPIFTVVFCCFPCFFTGYGFLRQLAAETGCEQRLPASTANDNVHHLDANQKGGKNRPRSKQLRREIKPEEMVKNKWEEDSETNGGVWMD